MAVVIYMVGLNYLNLPLFRRQSQRQLLGLSLNELIAQVNPSTAYHEFFHFLLS